MARSLADGAAQVDPPSQWRLCSGWPPLLYQTALSELYNLAFSKNQCEPKLKLPAEETFEKKVT